MQAQLGLRLTVLVAVAAGRLIFAAQALGLLAAAAVRPAEGQIHSKAFRPALSRRRCG